MLSVIPKPSMTSAAIPRYAAALLLMMCASANADLYAYTDEAGVLHLSDSPADARYRLALAAPRRCNR